MSRTKRRDGDCKFDDFQEKYSHDERSRHKRLKKELKRKEAFRKKRAGRWKDDGIRPDE